MNEKFSWQFNVVDEYKGMTKEEIKITLAKKAFPYAVLMENWQGDFNLGTLIRNANAFGAREVFYLGHKKHYDRRGAVGAYHYSDVNYLKNLEDLLALKHKYTFIGIDNIPGAVALEDFVWPDNPLLIFGEESIGLTRPMIDLCSSLVEIKMYGSVRSLNAGTASGITMYDFIKKYVDKLSTKS